MPMSRALAALLLGTVCCAAAGAAAAPAPCPSLLALVEQLPEASLFAELLFTLGATGTRCTRMRGVSIGK